MEIQQSQSDERKLIPKSSTDVKLPVVGGGQLQGCRGEPEERSPAKEQASPSVIGVEQLQKMKQIMSDFNMYLLINDSKHNHHDTDITGELQAKVAAKRILNYVAKPGARYIEEDNVLRFLKKSEVSDSGMPAKQSLKQLHLCSLCIPLTLVIGVLSTLFN